MNPVVRWLSVPFVFAGGWLATGAIIFAALALLLLPLRLVLPAEHWSATTLALGIVIAPWLAPPMGILLGASAAPKARGSVAAILSGVVVGIAVAALITRVATSPHPPALRLAAMIYCTIAVGIGSFIAARVMSDRPIRSPR